MKKGNNTEVMAIYRLDHFVKLYGNKKLEFNDDKITGYFPGIQTRSNPPKDKGGNIIPLSLLILKDHTKAVDWLFNDDEDGKSKINVLKVYFLDRKRIFYFIAVTDEQVKYEAELNFENKSLLNEDWDYYDNSDYYDHRVYDDGFESAFEGDSDLYEAWLYN